MNRSSLKARWSAGMVAAIGFFTAMPARAQDLATAPAAVVEPQTVELAYRTVGTDPDFDVREIALTQGIARGLDLGVRRVRPASADEGSPRAEQQLELRGLLGGPIDMMLVAGASAERPHAELPEITLAVSRETEWLALHLNVGRAAGADTEIHARARVEAASRSGLRPALETELTNGRFGLLGAGLLLGVSDELELDLIARFSPEALAPSVGAGLTWVLPASILGPS